MKRAGIILVIFMFMSAAVPAFAFDHGDLQIWNTDGLEAKLGDRWKMEVEEELRFGDDASELYYTHTDGGFVFKTFNWLDLGANYRLIYEKKKNKWASESRPHINATVKWMLWDFKFSDRNRFELHIPQGKDVFVAYRNKLAVELPIKINDNFAISPYVADEIFVDFEKGRFNRNRLSTGLKFDIMKHVKPEIYYMLQSSEKSSEKWTNYNIIGLKIKLAF